MKKVSVFFLLGVLSVTGFAQQKTTKSTATTISRPKLVVGIVVDQMRWDFLYRYYDRYGSGGFKRLLNEGFTCESTMINYLPSVTAVGHTAVFTGSVPAISGIVENNWIEQYSGKKMYCTDDSTVQSVGTNSNAGKMSPRNLLVSTVSDELHIATNFQAKVVGISLKDRGAILPVGRTADAAFWFDDATGSFISSTYYMQTLPTWAIQYNNSQPVTQLIKNGWNTLYPINTYSNSDSDNVEYEGMLKGEANPVFPHDINEIYKKSKGSFRTTPFGNTLVIDFAKQAIDGYQLGKDNVTDFLSISCSSTDAVGHTFGPNSIETEDTYLRLDQDLAKFFEFLDTKIGKGQYTVFLTADHGVAHNAGYMQKHKLLTEVVSTKSVTDTLNKLLLNKFGAKELVRSEITDQVDFNMKAINSLLLDFDAIKKATTIFLQQQPGIMYAVDMTKIGEKPLPQPLKSMLINGYNSKRSSPLHIIFDPGASRNVEKGTDHGTSHLYDTHIPLLFMGWGIHHGGTNETVNMTDIAPTISALLHIQMPNGNIGRVIKDVIK